MGENYLTLEQLSKELGYDIGTIRAILMQGRYKNFVSTSKDGQKIVSASIIDLLKPKQEKEEQEPQADTSDKDAEIEALRKENAELKETIKRKDSQIEEYAMKFAELAGQAQQLASQSQVLQLAEKGVTAEPPQKKGFFKRLFGR